MPLAREVDLSLRRVDPVDAAHDPRALRDLLLHLARRAVVQVQVIPPVALRHPDDLLPVGEVVAVFLGRVLEEGRRLLVDDGARLPGGGIDLDDAIDLMAALVVLERHRVSVLAPFEPGHVVRVRKERAIDVDLRARGDVEQHRRALVEHVAGLVVQQRRVLRLELILGRRLDVVHLAAIAGPNAIRGDVLRVRRPDDRLRVVRVALGAVGAQDRHVASSRPAGSRRCSFARMPRASCRATGERARPAPAACRTDRRRPAAEYGARCQHAPALARIRSRRACIAIACVSVTTSPGRPIAVNSSARPLSTNASLPNGSVMPVIAGPVFRLMSASIDAASRS